MIVDFGGVDSLSQIKIISVHGILYLWFICVVKNIKDNLVYLIFIKAFFRTNSSSCQTREINDTNSKIDIKNIGGLVKHVWLIFMNALILICLVPYVNITNPSRLHVFCLNWIVFLFFKQKYINKMLNWKHNFRCIFVFVCVFYHSIKLTDSFIFFINIWTFWTNFRVLAEHMVLLTGHCVWAHVINCLMNFAFCTTQYFDVANV